MSIRVAHLRIQGIDVAIFDARPTVNSEPNRAALLADLTARARLAGLNVEKSALAYAQGGTVMFYGTPDLVQYLQSTGVSTWTHWLDT